MKRIGRQVIKGKPAFRMKKKSQKERDWDRYNNYIAYIDEERSNAIMIETLKRHAEKLKLKQPATQS